MTNPRQQWLLKVIAGPHQGAELSLHAGKVLVGSDGECDVVLNDVLIAPQHLELELASTGIVVAPLGGRVFINGKRIRESRQSVPLFGFLSIGGSHVVIGTNDEKWPLLSAADVPELEKELDEPAPDSENKGAAKVAETTPLPNPAVSSTIDETGVSSQGSKLGPILGVIAGLVLLLGWGIIYSDFSATRSKSLEDRERKPLERARGVVEELGLVGSVKVEESGGRLTANGYVDSETRQRELQAVFRATVPGMRTKIYSLEKIASSARALIEDQHLSLTVTSLSEGKLKVTGKLGSAEPWIRMRQTLLGEVPGISGIEDAVEIEAPRARTQNTVFVPIPTVIMGNSPAAKADDSPSSIGKPELAPSPHDSPKTKTVTSPAITNSVDAITHLEAGPPRNDSEHYITQDTIDTPEAIVAAIRSSKDHLGFVRLSSGGVYFQGARLPYGGTIEKIEPDAVTILEKGENRILRQGDLVISPKNPINRSKP